MANRPSWAAFNASLFLSQPAIERQNLTMSALRILVPIKRVIDYAVSELAKQETPSDQFGPARLHLPDLMRP